MTVPAVAQAALNAYGFLLDVDGEPYGCEPVEGVGFFVWRLDWGSDEHFVTERRCTCQQFYKHSSCKHIVAVRRLLR